MTLKNRMFVAVLSLASLGLGTLPILGMHESAVMPFGEEATSRIGVEGALLVTSDRP